MPANLIEYLPSLLNQAIQYYSCFISHSHSDQRFCDRLYADLQARGVRVWYFPEDATWGRSVWGEIDRSIKLYDKLVVVCSEHSLQSSPVCREIERSLQREDREGKEVLFPIRLDNYLFDTWDHRRKADVVAKVVGDFRGWNRGTARYDAAFGSRARRANLMEHKLGALCLDGWAGRREVPVTIIGETMKYYRVILRGECMLPSRRWGLPGDHVSVPKTAVRLDESDGEE